MTPNSPTAQSIASSQLTYPVLVVFREDIWAARVLGWSECQAEGVTREQALQNLKHDLTERLAEAEIIYLQIPALQPENPWLKLAGKYRNDREFEELIAEMERERRELDTGMGRDKDETPEYEVP